MATKVYSHRTALREEELRQAAEMPMHREVQDKLQFMLEAVDMELKESQKYFWASAVFLTINILGLLFNQWIMIIFGLLGAFIMVWFQHRAGRHVPKRMGFVDGIFWYHHHLAKDIKAFEQELNKDDSEIPEEVRNAIKNVKAKAGKMNE